MECNKVLLDSVNNSLQRNLNKKLIAFFLILIITFLVTPMAMFIALLTGSIVLSVLSVLAVSFLISILVYGFFVLTTKLYRGENAILGDIFIGFRSKKNVFSVSFFFGGLAILICFCSVFIGLSFFMPQQVSGDINEIKNFVSIISNISFISITIFVLFVVLPNIFLFNITFDYPEYTLMHSIRVNHDLLKGKFFKLIFFLLRCAGIWLIITICGFFFGFFLDKLLLQNFILDSKFLSTISQLLAKIAHGSYLVGFYMSIIRFISGIVVFYEDIKNPVSFYTKQFVIEQQIIEE